MIQKQSVEVQTLFKLLHIRLVKNNEISFYNLQTTEVYNKFKENILNKEYVLLLCSL